MINMEIRINHFYYSSPNKDHDDDQDNNDDNNVDDSLDEEISHENYEVIMLPRLSKGNCSK